MSVDEWAAGCVKHIRKLLDEIEGGGEDAFKPLSSGRALSVTTLHLDMDLGDLLKTGSVKINSKDQIPWGTRRTDWYVIVRATPEVLAEVVKRLKGHDLMQHDDTTLWVISKKMPASKRRELTK